MSYSKNILLTALLGSAAAACDFPLNTTTINTSFGNNSVEVTEHSSTDSRRHVYDFTAKTSTAYFGDGSSIVADMNVLEGADSADVANAANLLADHKAGKLSRHEVSLENNNVSVVKHTDRQKLYTVYSFNDSTVNAPYNTVPLINAKMDKLRGKDSVELAEVIRFRASRQARKLSL